MSIAFYVNHEYYQDDQTEEFDLFRRKADGFKSDMTGGIGIGVGFDSDFEIVRQNLENVCQNDYLSKCFDFKGDLSNQAGFIIPTETYNICLSNTGVCRRSLDDDILYGFGARALFETKQYNKEAFITTLARRHYICNIFKAEKISGPWIITTTCREIIEKIQLLYEEELK